MPLAAPIGSNKGLATKAMIQVLIDEIDLPIIVDAGIGKAIRHVKHGNGCSSSDGKYGDRYCRMYQLWRMPLSWLLKQEEKLTLQEWEESWQEASASDPLTVILR